METGVGSTVLLVSVPYLSQPTIDALTASILVADSFWFLESLNRPSAAPKMVQTLRWMSHLSLPGILVLSPFSLNRFVAASSSAPASQRQKSSPRPSVMSPTSVFSVGTPVLLTVVEPSAPAVASHTVG